jgi:hypothetical protein
VKDSGASDILDKFQKMLSEQLGTDVFTDLIQFSGSAEDEETSFHHIESQMNTKIKDVQLGTAK